jgi:hypothetical protein
MNITVVFLSYFVLNILLCIIPDDDGGQSKHVGGIKKCIPKYIAHAKLPLIFFLRRTLNLCPSVSLRGQVTQHNGQIYSSVYFEIYISEWKTRR